MGVLNLYSDPQCKNSAIQIEVGSASLSSYLQNKSNWTAYIQDAPIPNKPSYTIVTNDQESTITASDVFDFMFKNTVPINDLNPILVDTVSNLSSDSIQNAFFISNYENKHYGIRFNITYVETDDSYTGSMGIIGFHYTCTPENATLATRETWNYNVSDTYKWHPSASTSISSNSRFSCCKVAQVSLWNETYYLFATGVNASGKFNTQSGRTSLMLIPCDYFKNKSPVDPVGKQTKDKKDKAYRTGTGLNGTGSGRKGYSSDPYGIKGGVSTDLVALTDTQMNALIGAIYGRFWIDVNGVEVETSVADNQLKQKVNKMARTTTASERIFGVLANPLESIYNLGTKMMEGSTSTGGIGTSIGQALSGQISTQKAEIIQHILDGILVCQLVPKFYGLVGGASTINKIAGVELPTCSCSSVSAVCNEVEFQMYPITRYTQTFLDFEPFTTCVLHLPFVGEVNVPPSVLMNGLKIKYLYDVYAGGISVEVSTCNNYCESPNWSVITCKQSGCAVDVPIVGTGRNTKGQEKLAASLASIATGGPAGALAGVANLLMNGDTYSLPVPVTKQSNPGVNPYMSPRDIYLEIRIPKPANDENWPRLIGYKFNGSGNISAAGYYEVDNIDLSGLSAPQSVKEQIISRLREGVFVI